MNQKSFADISWERKDKTTRREKFLAEMSVAIPWIELEGLIFPFAPKVVRSEVEGSKRESQIKADIHHLFLVPASTLSASCITHTAGLKERLDAASYRDEFCRLSLSLNPPL